MALLYLVKWFALKSLDLAGDLQTVPFTRWVFILGPNPHPRTREVKVTYVSPLPWQPLPFPSQGQKP